MTELVGRLAGIELAAPYFVHREGLPGLDFNREIIAAGESEDFPAGAVGIRVDDDFWAVAALPLEYAEAPLREIVAALWPEYAAEAVVCPDHGTPDQRVYQAEGWARSLEEQNRHLNKELLAMREQLERLRSPRPGLHQRIESRHKAHSSYFVRQYEHLLIATAHDHEPSADRPGVCRRCGLYGSDRVHTRHYLELHAKGYEPAMKHLTDYPETDG